MIYIIEIPFKGNIKITCGNVEFIIGELQYKHETSMKGLTQLLDLNSARLNAQIHFMSTDEALDAFNNDKRWTFDRGDEVRKLLGEKLCLKQK